MKQRLMEVLIRQKMIAFFVVIGVATWFSLTGILSELGWVDIVKFAGIIFVAGNVGEHVTKIPVIKEVFTKKDNNTSPS